MQGRSFSSVASSHYSSLPHCFKPILYTNLHVLKIANRLYTNRMQIVYKWHTICKKKYILPLLPTSTLLQINLVYKEHPQELWSISIQAWQSFKLELEQSSACFELVQYKTHPIRHYCAKPIRTHFCTMQCIQLPG